MSDPWDPPPLPRHGDDSASVTHEWFGRAVGQWVHVEFQLALLYSLFVGRPRHGEAVKEFGAGVTFRQRLDRLRSKAERFFAGRELKRLETEFQAICVAAEGFARRRNEVAHSVVFPSVFLPSFVEDRLGGFDGRWALAPPYYSLKDFDDQGFPKYAYTSRQLNALVNRFAEFKKRIEDLEVELLDEARREN
ncbi:hypothetical protein [Bradyrhizobium sp. S69]|uniref:hypothetical protein n=1 Tax=Bradyrhizobium sp. S69 TaxID=1641856 RepID=UPI00131B3019|nr:hypothetical protein [Bradyrhizobium sp. S69]